MYSLLRRKPPAASPDGPAEFAIGRSERGTYEYPGSHRVSRPGFDRAAVCSRRPTLKRRGDGHWRWPLILGVFSVLALSGALAAGILPRSSVVRTLRAAAAEVSASLPRVTLAAARAMTTAEERVLPGNFVAASGGCHLRPHQRLSQEQAGRDRRSRGRRPASGGDCDSRNRRPARAGPRHVAPDAGQPYCATRPTRCWRRPTSLAQTDYPARRESRSRRWIPMSPRPRLPAPPPRRARQRSR